MQIAVEVGQLEIRRLDGSNGLPTRDARFAEEPNIVISVTQGWLFKELGQLSKVKAFAIVARKA
jgi:hypothetical protein